jgi:hypothetical protein
MSITGIGYPQVFRLGSASKTLIRSRVVATLAYVGMHDGRLGIEISISHLGFAFPGSSAQAIRLFLRYLYPLRWRFRETGLWRTQGISHRP